MAISLSSLRIEAELDARKYVEGMRQKTAADTSGVQSGERLAGSLDRVSGAAEQTDRRLGASRGISDLARRYVEGASAAQELERGVGRLGRAIERDNSTLDRAGSIYEGMVRKTGMFADASAVANRGQVAFADVISQVNVRLAAQAEAIERTATKARAAASAFGSQTQINAQLGVRDDFGGAARAQDVAAYGQVLDQLRAKYSPLFAAQQAYRSELTDINQALRVGALNQAEHAAAIDRTKTAFAAQAQVLTGAAARLREVAAAEAEAARAALQLGAIWDAASARVGQLAEKFDPATTSARRMAAEMADLNAAQRSGITIAGGYASAYDRIVAKYDEGAQAAARMAAAQSQVVAQTRAEQQAISAQAGFNQILRVNPGSGAGAAAASAAVFEEAFWEQERLAAAAQKYRDVFNPLLPLQRAYRAELASINEVTRAGILTEQQHAAAIAQTKVAFAAQVLATTGATAAAREKTIADRAAAAEQDRLGAVAQRYRDQLNPLLPLQRAYKAELASINQVAVAGLLTDQQRLASIQRAKDAFAGQVTSLRAVHDETVKATASTGQMRASLVNLGQQAQDVVVSLQSGQAPLTVLLQQGSQIATVFAATPGGVSGVLSAVGTAIRGIIVPIAAISGVAALATGVGILVARASDANQSIRVLNVLLEGMGTTALTNATSLEAAAKRLRDVGLSAAEARAQIAAVGQAGLNPAAAEQIIRTGANLTAFRGGDQTQALTAALAGGVESAVKYGLAVRALTVDEAANRLEMARHGQAAQALDLIFQSITSHAQGLRDKGMSPLAKSVEQMAVAWNNLLDRLSNSRPIQVLTDSLTGLINALDKLAQGKPPAWLNALLAFQTLGVGGIGAAGPIGMALQSTATPAATATVPGYDNTQTALNYFQNQGLTAQQSAGVVGRLFAESGMNPAAVNPTSGAFGIAQWLGGREKPLAGSTDLMRQLELVWQEFQTTEIAAYQKIIESRTAGEAAIAMERFERAGKPAFTQKGVQFAEQIAAGGRPGVGITTLDTFAQAALEARKYAAAQDLAAKATQGVGFENEKARIAAEVAGRTELDGAEQARLATDLFAAAKVRLTNEITNAAAATANELTGQTRVADALLQGSKAGLVAENALRAATEAYQRFGEVSSEASKKFAEDRFKEISALETQAERIRNNRDLLAGRETQEQLRLQISLTGQLPEIVQREVTLLQEKQRIEREFAFLLPEEKANRLAMVQATADLNVKLAETQRAQQQIDSLFSSIGNTISNTIGNAIEGIFDRKKIQDWGSTLRSMLSSVSSQIVQSLLVRPLTGELLGALGASASVVNQFGTFGGAGSGSSSGGGIFDFLFKGAGVAKDVAGLGSSSSGGLLGGFNSFIDSSIGPALGFATPGTSSLSSLIGIEASTLTSAGIANAGSAATAGSLFGLTSLSSVLPFVGIAGGILGMILPSLFGNKKPRNQSAGASFDLADFSLTAGFAGGNSQIDQQTQQVAQGVQEFLALLQTTGGALSGSVLLQHGVNTGFTVDSSLPGYEGRFSLGKDPTAALQTIELALARSLTGISATMKTVIDQIGDPAEIESAIAFAQTYDDLSKAAEDAFASIEEGKNELGPFRQAMDSINATFGALTDQANRFGLALEPLNAALAEATKRLQDDFTDALNEAFNQASGSGFLNELQNTWDSYLASITESQAIGLGLDRPTQDLLGQVATAEINSILSGLDRSQLDQVIAEFSGLNDTIVMLAQSAGTAASATLALSAAQERAAQAAQASQTIADYLAQLNSTAGTFVSPENALMSAQFYYDQQLLKAQAGDVDALSNITQYADAFITAIEGYYHSSLYGQSLVQEIKDELGALIGITPADPALVTNDLLQTQISTTQDVGSTVAAGTDQTLSSMSVTTQQLIAANDAAAALAISQNNANAANLIDVVGQTASAGVAASFAQAEFLVDQNNQAATAIIAQNDASAAALIAANDDAATSIIAQNAMAAATIAAANDNATAALLVGADTNTAILAQVNTNLANSLAGASYGAASSIVDADRVYADNLASAVFGAASSIVQASAGFADSIVLAVTGGTNMVVMAGASYSDAATLATYGAANSIINTSATYANNTILAIAAASTSNDNWLSKISYSSDNLYAATVAYGENARAQRDSMISLLAEVRDTLRMLSASAGTLTQAA